MVQDSAGALLRVACNHQTDERYLEYVNKVPDCYITGDRGFYDEDGYLFIMGRMNRK